MPPSEALGAFPSKPDFGLAEKWPSSLSELVQGWLAFQQEFKAMGENSPSFWAYDTLWDIREQPEWIWKFILAAMDMLEPENESFAMLATDPLEDLLADHGSVMIAQIENEARRSPKFRLLLRGVWKSHMTEEVWQRVQDARS